MKTPDQRLRTFTCSCCGEWFQSCLEKQRPFDKDKGYGLCPGCEVFVKKDEQDRMNKLINQMTEQLNPENRAKFLSYDRELQGALVMEAINEGAATLSFGKAKVHG